MGLKLFGTVFRLNLYDPVLSSCSSCFNSSNFFLLENPYSAFFFVIIDVLHIFQKNAYCITEGLQHELINAKVHESKICVCSFFLSHIIRYVMVCGIFHILFCIFSTFRFSNEYFKWKIAFVVTFSMYCQCSFLFAFQIFRTFSIKQYHLKVFFSIHSFFCWMQIQFTGNYVYIQILYRCFRYFATLIPLVETIRKKNFY